MKLLVVLPSCRPCRPAVLPPSLAPIALPAGLERLRAGSCTSVTTSAGSGAYLSSPAICCASGVIIHARKSFMSLGLCRVGIVPADQEPGEGRDRIALGAGRVGDGDPEIGIGRPAGARCRGGHAGQRRLTNAARRVLDLTAYGMSLESA